LCVRPKYTGKRPLTRNREVTLSDSRGIIHLEDKEHSYKLAQTIRIHHNLNMTVKLELVSELLKKY